MKPTRIDATNADEFEGNWSDEADVVIVGSGFAGLAAAIEAKNAGASVIILEKMKGRGGNSIISDGLVAAAGSPLQQKSRINDSAQLMVADMLRAGQGLNYPDLIKVVADKSNQAVQWTIDFFGVQYRDKLEQLGGHSVPRTFVTNKQSGSVIVKGMLKKIGELGMSVRTRVYLERIKRNPSGDVNGVIVRDGYAFPFAESGTKKFIRARKAVILATGGFSNDVAFRSIQDPRLTELFDTTNKKGATAEALKEALRVGAAPVQLSWIQLGPWTSPDEKMYGIGPQFADYVAEPYGIMVDPDSGKRFVNELADRKIKADAILALGYPCVAIADAQGVGKSAQNIDKCLKRGVVKGFDTLKALASTYGIPLNSLQETLQVYNQSVKNKKDAVFGKPIFDGALPIVHPPFYAIRLWPKVHYTMGGIRINCRAQVIDMDNNPIHGFYAAGEVTGGIHGACRLGSCSITECLVFGRIAGKNAASETTR